MEMKENFVSKLELGRAEFAYKCAEDGKKIMSASEIDGEWYQDDNYRSYVRRLPSMIVSNGLGQTLAFVLSKRAKTKDGKKPGSRDNPKNAYDLIYHQLTNYIKNLSFVREFMPESKTDLAEFVISCDSAIYRYITEEILAFLRWLAKFADGLIEEEGE
jgi:CRISPR-associated protein Cmr5